MLRSAALRHRRHRRHRLSTFLLAPGLALALVSGALALPARAVETTDCASVLGGLDESFGEGFSHGFVAAWDSRFAGTDATFTWDGYQGTAGTLHDDIAAAEHHAALAPTPDRACLVDALVSRMTAEGLRQDLPAGLLPAFVYGLVFEERFLDHALGGKDPVSAADPAPVSDPALKTAVTGLRDALQLPATLRLPDLPALPKVALPDLRLPHLVLPHLRQLLRVDLPTLPTLPRLDLSLPLLDLTSLRRLVASTVSSATYLVCTNPSATAPTSTDRCGLPTALGAPATADVNGDLIPDVVVTILPDVQAIAGGGFGATLTFARPPLRVGGSDLPGRVYAVIQPPGTTTHVTIGTQNAKTLADSASAKVVFSSLQELTKGIVRGPVQLTWSGANAPSTTVLLSTSHYVTTPSEELDPTALAATITPVPSQLSAQLRIDGTPTSTGAYAGRARSLISLEGLAATPARADRYDLGLDMDRRQGDGLTTLHGAVTDLPGLVSFSVDSYPATANGQQPATMVGYTGSSTTPLVSASLEQRLATAAAGTRTLSQVSVTDLPARIDATLVGRAQGLAASQEGSSTVTYDATTTIPLVTAHLLETVAGETKSAIDASLTGVPKHVVLRTSGTDDAKSTRIDLDGSSPLAAASVEALLAKLTGDRSVTRVHAQAAALPPSARIALLQPNDTDLTASYDGRSGPDAPRGSARIGALLAQVATAPGSVPPDYLKPSPALLADYAKAHAFVQKTADKAVRADLRLDGLGITDVAVTDKSTADNDETVRAHVEGPGAPEFVASADLPGLSAVSHLTPLPAVIDVDIAGTGAGVPQCVAPQAAADVIIPPPGAQAVPADAAGDQVTCVSYRVSGASPVATTTIETPDITASGTLEGVPSTATLRLNTTRSTIGYSAGGRVPLVTAQVTTHLAGFGDDLTVNGRLTGVPSRFRLSYDKGSLGFLAPATDRVDEVTARAALSRDVNTLDAMTVPPGNHVLAVVDDDPGLGGKHLYADLKLSQLQAFGYSGSNEMRASFDGAEGTRLDLGLDLTTLGTPVSSRLVIDGAVGSVPPALRLSKSDVPNGIGLTLGAGASYPTDARVLVGPPQAVQSALAHVAEIPRVEGLSARDWPGADGAATGLGISFGATPSSVSVNTGTLTFGFGGYAPTATDKLDVDVLLDDGAKPLILSGGLTGYGPTPSSLALGPVVTRPDTADSDPAVPDLSLTVASTGLRPRLDLQVRMPADKDLPPAFLVDKVLGLHLDAVPVGPLTFNTVNYVQPHPSTGDKPDVALRFWTSTLTDRVDAEIGHASITYGPTTAPNALVADVRHVPGDFFDLTLGDIIADSPSDPCAEDTRTALPDKQYPKVRYTASASTLDADIGVDFGALSGLPKSMVLDLGIRDLGQDTSITFKDAVLQMDSSPKTSRIQVDVDGVTKQADEPQDPRCAPAQEDGGALRLVPVVDVNASVTIPHIGMTLEDLQSMTLSLGVVSSVQGDFGKFDLSVPFVTGEAHAQVGVDVIFDFGGPFHGTISLRVGPSISGAFVPLFHVGANAPGQGFTLIDTPIPCGIDLPPPTFGVGIQLKPGLLDGVTGSLRAGGFSLTDPGPDQGGAWTLTPNLPLGVIGNAPVPTLPEWAINLLTFVVPSAGTSRGLSFGVICD